MILGLNSRFMNEPTLPSAYDKLFFVCHDFPVFSTVLTEVFPV